MSKKKNLVAGAMAGLGACTLIWACSNSSSSGPAANNDPTPSGTTPVANAPYAVCSTLEPGSFTTNSGGSFAEPATTSCAGAGGPASGPPDTHCGGTSNQSPAITQTVNGTSCSIEDGGPAPGDDAGTTTEDAGDGGVIVAANPNITAMGGSATPSLPVGSATTPVTVTGTGFVSGSTVSFDGTALTTTFTSSTALSVSVPSTILATSGTPSVVVTNPGGAASPPFTFFIAGPCDENGPDGAYGGTKYGTTGNDDDCKYYVTYTPSPLCENNGTYFVVTANYLTRTLADGGLAPLTGASTYAEVCLNSTHPGPTIDSRPPDGNQQVVEGPPGTYTVGPVQFDESGMWTVRFHFNEFCCDVADDSPHGHAAFFMNVP